MTFRLFGIPVKVHAAFWLTLALLGGVGVRTPVDFVSWCVVAAFSILLHELGHAFAGRAFGLSPRVDLYAMGGNTAFFSGASKPLGPWRSILVSLAGPLPGVLIGGAAWLLSRRYLGEGSPAWQHTVAHDVMYVNLVWSAFNLLPVLPLDGGRIMASLMQIVGLGDPERKARFVSIGTAIVIGLLCLKFTVLFAAALMGLFAWRNYQGLASVKVLEVEHDLASQLAEAQRALEARDGKALVAIAEPVVFGARTRDVRAAALRYLAYGRILEGQWAGLIKLVEEASFELGVDELVKLEQAADELGRPDDAASIRAARARLLAQLA